MLQSLQKKSLTTQQLWVKYRHSDVESSAILFSSSKVLTGFLRNLRPTFLFPSDSVWSTRRSDLKILLPVKKSWRVGEKMRLITARKKILKETLWIEVGLERNKFYQVIGIEFYWRESSDIIVQRGISVLWVQ